MFPGYLGLEGAGLVCKPMSLLPALGRRGPQKEVAASQQGHTWPAGDLLKDTFAPRGAEPQAGQSPWVVEAPLPPTATGRDPPGACPHCSVGIHPGTLPGQVCLLGRPWFPRASPGPSSLAWVNRMPHAPLPTCGPRMGCTRPPALSSVLLFQLWVWPAHSLLKQSTQDT